MKNTRLHVKLQYDTIKARLSEITPFIRLDLAYKTIYDFNVDHDAWLFYAKWINKKDLLETLSDLSEDVRRNIRC